MNSDWTITTNEDDSVTLESKNIKAEIKAKTWKEANNMAHVLASVISLKIDIENSSRIVRSCLYQLKNMQDQIEVLKTIEDKLSNIYLTVSTRKDDKK